MNRSRFLKRMHTHLFFVNRSICVDFLSFEDIHLHFSVLQDQLCFNIKCDNERKENQNRSHDSIERKFKRFHDVLFNVLFTS